LANAGLLATASMKLCCFLLVLGMSDLNDPALAKHKPDDQNTDPDQQLFHDGLADLLVELVRHLFDGVLGRSLGNRFFALCQYDLVHISISKPEGFC